MPALWEVLKPNSGYALSDLGQAFALAVAGLSVGHTAVDIIKVGNEKRLLAGLSVQDCFVKMERQCNVHGI
jgi:hypothetical protein